MGVALQLWPLLCVSLLCSPLTLAQTGSALVPMLSLCYRQQQQETGLIYARSLVWKWSRQDHSAHLVCCAIQMLAICAAGSGTAGSVAPGATLTLHLSMTMTGSSIIPFTGEKQFAAASSLAGAFSIIIGSGSVQILSSTQVCFDMSLSMIWVCAARHWSTNPGKSPQGAGALCTAMQSTGMQLFEACQRACLNAPQCLR